MHAKYLLVALLAALPAKSALTAPVATDSASNPAYDLEAGGAWKGLQSSLNENPPGTDNGGVGFLPWSFQGGLHDASASPYGNLNHFIDGVDFAHSTFNNLGNRAFALTNANIAHLGFTARATRVFSQPLTVGGTFSLNFDNPVLAPLANNDETGYIIRLNSGSGANIASNPNVHERFGLFAFDGFQQNNWNLTDASGASDTGVNSIVTTTGATFRFTLQTTESYLFEIVPLGGGTALYSATGNLASSGTGSIDTLEIVMFGNGSGNGQIGVAALPTGQREFFFDQLFLDNPLTFPVGDYNRNGTVDAADYSVWRFTLAETVPVGEGADGDRDGVVTQLDYDLWRQHFGNAAAAGSSAAINGSIIVPEPDATAPIWLALIGLVLVLARSPCNG